METSKPPDSLLTQMPTFEDIQKVYEQVNQGSVYGQECKLEDLLEK